MRCKYPDPRERKIAIDANALNRDSGASNTLVDRILEMDEEELIELWVPNRVRNEINHPRTPHQLKNDYNSKIFSNPVQLTAQEREDRHRNERVLQGNALTDKHSADADHLQDASKYGCLYFVTHDKRILKKAQEMPRLRPLQATTLKDFLDIYDDYEAGRRP